MTTETRWRFAGASVIGSSHERSGQPCQDSHACQVLYDHRKTPMLAIVVSDGAGSVSDSDMGAMLTCDVLLEQLQVLVDTGRSLADLTEGEARDWLDAVREAIAVQAGEDSLAMRDYACTLLMAVVSEDTSLFLQLGDGAIVVSREPGEWSWVFWPDRGEFANTTYFVTDETAAQHLQVALKQRGVAELAVFSDGIEALVLHYATKTVHASFFERMLPPVRASAAAGEDGSLSGELKKYLASSAVTQRTDDDKTLVLATRRDPVAIDTSTTPAAPSPSDA